MVIGMTVLHGQRLVMESDQTQTEAQPEDGPWNKSWKELAKSAGTYVEDTIDTVKQAVSSVKMPWEKSNAEMAATTNYDQQRIDATKNAPVPQASQSISLDPSTLFGRLINTESGGKHLDKNGNLLTSNRGAQGISQVVPETAKSPGFGVTPIQNNSQEEYLRFGGDYLNALIKNFGGDQTKAVAAYNAGPGAVDRAVAKAAKSGGSFVSYLPAETQKYVKKIIGA